MKILLTGATGYIGSRLLHKLLEAGHFIYPLVRSKSRFLCPKGFEKQIQVIEADLMDAKSLENIPVDIDAAYYFVHSMSASSTHFSEMEALSSQNFAKRLQETQAKQIIYLSGLVNEEKLSSHLASRKNVDEILRKGKVPVTTLMAAIIIGSESASFKIMKDLVRKLPLMITPKWTLNQVQPIAIQDVLDYLVLVLHHPDCIGKRFEIGGPDIYSYKEMLLRLAKILSLKRVIISVPLFTPKLSSYWLVFITSASYPLAKSLVQSLKNNAVCKEHAIEQIFPKKLLHFDEAVRLALFHAE